MFRFYSILRSTAGRNNTGSITVRHRGPSKYLRRSFNYFDFKKKNFDFFKYPDSKIKNLCVGIDPSNLFNFIVFKGLFFSNLGSFSPGDFVRNIAGTPAGFPKYVRSIYSRSLIIKRLGSRMLVRIPSGEIRKFKSDCSASPALNTSYVKKEPKFFTYKAGWNRKLGYRPSVRGCAINPVDHPHGGRTGESRPSVSPWAQLTKGYKTRTRSFDKRYVYRSVRYFKNRR
jgi:large subunit ribosomal protein L2